MHVNEGCFEAKRFGAFTVVLRGTVVGCLTPGNAIADYQIHVGDTPTTTVKYVNVSHSSLHNTVHTQRTIHYEEDCAIRSCLQALHTESCTAPPDPNNGCTRQVNSTLPLSA